MLVLPAPVTSALSSLAAIPQQDDGPAYDPPPEPPSLQDYARQQAERYGLDPHVFDAQINQESGYQNVTNPNSGAQGPGQLMPDTARGLGVDPSDPYQNLEGAARYHRQLLDYYDGDQASALAAYNAGPGNIDTIKKRYGADWRNHLTGVSNDVGLDLTETNTYLDNILGGGGAQQSGYGPWNALGRPSPYQQQPTQGQTPADPALANIAAGEAGAQEQYGQGAPGLDQGVVAQTLLGSLRKRNPKLIDDTLGSGSGFLDDLGKLEKKTRIADIPYADKVRGVTTKILDAGLNSLPIGSAYNLGRAGVKAAGGSSLPSLGEVTNPVPTNVRDALLLALPEAKAAWRGIGRVATGVEETRAAANAFKGVYPEDWGPEQIAQYERVKASVVGNAPEAGTTAAEGQPARLQRIMRQGREVPGGASTGGEVATTGTGAGKSVWNMSREEFLGKPRITSRANAADLAVTDYSGDVPAEPFMGDKFTIKRGEPGWTASPEKIGPRTYTVLDGDKPVAWYDGSSLVVDPKYRRQGIAENLVYDFRVKNPDVPPAESRTAVAQHVQENVWNRIQREKRQGLTPTEGTAGPTPATTMPAGTPAGGTSTNAPTPVTTTTGAEPGDMPEPAKASTEEPPVNFDDVRGKFLKAAQDERNLRATGRINRENAAGRSAQAGGILNALRKGGSLDEVGQAVSQGAYQGGTLRKSFLKPIELSPAEQGAVVEQLQNMATNGEISPFEVLRVLSPATSHDPGILAKLQSKTPKLMPHEVRLIRKLFGDEVAKASQERSDLSLEPEMTAAQEQKLIESINSTEAKQAERSAKQSQAEATRANRAETRAQETQDAKDLSAAKRAVDKARRAEAAALADENKANMRALDAMGKPYHDAAREEWDANMRALAAEWKSSYDGIFRRAEEAATNLGGPNAGAIIRYQLQGNRAILDRLTSPDGLDRIAHTVRSAFTGDLADSYLTALQRRTETLRSAFVADGMDPEIAGKVATTFRDAELRKRYGSTTMPKQIADSLAEMKAPAYGESWGALDKFIQRWKNTVYSTDFGVVGTQLKATIDRGGVSGLAGYVNRVLTMLNLPHADLYSAEVNLPKQIRNIMDGLYVGAAPSATQPAQGTLFSYALDRMGKPGEKVNKSIEWLMDKGNAIQFKGILGHARDVSYEGNLAILKMLGRDIGNPRVRRTAADYANATSLFANAALNSTRAGWERRLVTSVPMMRSEIANILQMAKFFNPSASAEERILASTSILSRVVSVLLVGKLINDQLGISDYVMNPFEAGFGSITSPIKDASGRNVVFSMFPQESLVKAIGKAVLALKDSDPETAGRTLLQGISGRLSLPAQAIENLAGYGYDNEGKFHTGDLHLGPGGLLQKTFMPPIGSQALQDPSSVYLAAQTFGVSAFPESTSSVKDRAAQEQFGKSYNDLKPLDRAKIDKDEAVTNSKAASEPTDYQKRKADVTAPLDARQQQAEDAWKKGELSQPLPDIWHDISIARHQAALDLSTQFAEQFKGFNKSQYDTALEGLYKIQVTTPDGSPDFTATDAKRAEYMKTLTPDQQQWVKEAQQVSQEKQSPVYQQYRAYIDKRKELGYYEPNVKPAQLAALDKANPMIDLQNWLFKGGVKGNDKAPALNSEQAVKSALAMGLPAESFPVKLAGLPRPINQTPGSQQAWQDTGPLMNRYLDAARNPTFLDAGARNRYGGVGEYPANVKFTDLTDSQKARIVGDIHTEILDDPKTGSLVDAALAYWGTTSTLHSDEALVVYNQMIKRYGAKAPTANAKPPTIAANAR